MRIRLLLALAVLVSGLVWQAYSTGCRPYPAIVERAAISIERVHDGTLPMHIEGTGTVTPTGSHSNGGIESAQIENADFAQRGTVDQRYAEMNLFRVEPDGKTALRVPVRFRVVTPDLIEIKEGLREGDQVIVSDMSRWSNVDRIVIE